MKSVRPNFPEETLVTVAENQPEFETVIVGAGYDAMYPHNGYNTVTMAFRPTEADKARIAAGADIYVTLLTFGYDQQGVRITAGVEDTLSYVCPVALRPNA